MGVVSGEMLVDGRLRNSGFQRKTGYVQQQDLHLATTTVREALVFSALLRQPKKVPRKEKIDYVEEVIKTMEMQSYADAIVGVPGEGELTLFPLVHFIADQDRSQRRTAQAPHYSGRARRKARTAPFPRRTNIWPRQSNCMVNPCLAQEARKQWPGYFVHNSSAFRHLIPRI